MTLSSLERVQNLSVVSPCQIQAGDPLIPSISLGPSPHHTPWTVLHGTVVSTLQWVSGHMADTAAPTSFLLLGSAFSHGQPFKCPRCSVCTCLWGISTLFPGLRTKVPHFVWKLEPLEPGIICIPTFQFVSTGPYTTVTSGL